MNLVRWIVDSIINIDPIYLGCYIIMLTFNEYWENLVAVTNAFLNRFIFNRPPRSDIGLFIFYLFFFCLYIVFRLMTTIPAAFKQRDRSINLYFTSVHCSFLAITALAPRSQALISVENLAPLTTVSWYEKV